MLRHANKMKKKETARQTDTQTLTLPTPTHRRHHSADHGEHTTHITNIHYNYNYYMARYTNLTALPPNIIYIKRKQNY